MVSLLTLLLIIVFLIRLRILLKKRNHPDYLFMISISTFRLMIIISIYIFSIAFSLEIFRSILYANHSSLSILLLIDSLMEKTILLGLLVLFSSLGGAFFFINQLEFLDDKVIFDDEIVSWSLKKYSSQIESTCYIQIYAKKRNGLYLIINIDKLGHALRKVINIDTSFYIPQKNREEKLINILNSHKKNSKIIFLSRPLVISIVIAGSTMFLSLIHN